MASTPPNNVFSLDAHARARARLSPQESEGIIADCRDLALERTVKALAGVLDGVEDELFKLAEGAPDRESQNLYLDARVQARGNRPALEAVFRRQFLALFNRKVAGAPGAAREAAPQALALVGEDELEQALALQGMAARLRTACEGELGALSRRFGFLLEKPDLPDEANPVSPESVCGALKDACDQLEAGWKVRFTLLRVLEERVTGELLNVYRDLNAHLVARQVLPEIKLSVRRNPSSAQPAAAANGATAPAANPDVFAALAELLGAAAPAGASPNPLAAAQALVAGAQAPVAGAPAAAAAPPSAATLDFVRSLGALHRQSAQGADAATALANVIRDLRQAPQTAALAGVDAMTIDIVAMLFDYIFEDRQVPTSVKALLGRLQIPTLKVALLDRAFFSSRTHPARQLLDRLARASIGMDEASERGMATLAKLEEVVGEVLAQFEEDPAVFARLAAQMQEFLAQQDEAEEAIARRTARLVEERERIEIARAVAEAEIDQRIAAREWVPEPVRAMLEDVWVRTLASAHAEHGEDGAPWRAMVATADELLWSVEPKAKVEDRRRLVAGIPSLIRRIQEGMARAGIAEAMREAFLGALVDCHADAVKAGLKGTALPQAGKAQEAAPPRAPAGPSLEREVVPAGDIHVEEIRLRTPRGQPPVRNVFTRTGIWTHVKRFTWVEFRREEAPALRARLTWISPNKGVYLFTNSTARAAISVSPEALAEQMRRGEARIVDDSPLVDRAVDSMLASLRECA